MSNALAEYLSALEARDVRERAHEEYIKAYTRLADRTASSAHQVQPVSDDTTPTQSVAAKALRPSSPKGKGPAATSDASSPSTVAQLRSELAVTQRTRGELETKLSDLSTELTALKAADTQQKQHIERLTKHKANLERRGKDRAEELKGKGKLFEDVQDELVALNIQLNMAEQEKEKLKKENDDLTQRWVKKMEEEAQRMNDRMGWEESGRRKGSRS
ncbi:autophagy protein 16, interacts with Atg12p-Atg5p [Coniothyrium glycines]